MLNELLPDIRNLLDLTRRIENFDATVIAARMHGNAIDVASSALDERHRMTQEAAKLRVKWGI